MNDLERLWNCEFIKYNIVQLAKMNIPIKTRELLVNVGLPKDHYTFQYSDVKFYDLINLNSITFNNKKYFVIGEISYGKICVNLENDEVNLILDDDEQIISYINSSIEKFLMIYPIFYSKLETLGEERDEKILKMFVEDLKNLFNEIDSKIIKDKESYWSTIIEEYEQGAI